VLICSDGSAKSANQHIPSLSNYLYFLIILIVSNYLYFGLLTTHQMAATIQPEIFRFCEELKQNNNKPWFEANKPRYEKLKEGFTVFMTELLVRLQKIDNLPGIDPKKTVFRIYRDVRFSKDKTPYKSHMAAVIDRGPKWQNKCGFYIHLEPGGCFIGGGAWEPSPQALKAIRQEIDYNAEPLLDILNDREFKKLFGGLGGDRLMKAPKDYLIDHPHIDLLKHKQFLVSRPFTDEEVLSATFQDELVKTYKTALPFFNYLDIVLKEATEGEKEKK
jgi:uncharacterized protein (TIGR02453 family)